MASEFLYPDIVPFEVGHVLIRAAQKGLVERKIYDPSGQVMVNLSAGRGYYSLNAGKRKLYMYKLIERQKDGRTGHP